MKNPTPRQKTIMKLVSERENVSIDDIQKSLGISQATAYREIQSLTQMGLAAKIPGGIGRLETSSRHCFQCGAEVNSRIPFLIEQEDGKQLVACCAHCGLMALARLTDIRTTMTTDFLYGTMIHACQAWYVISSNIFLCCKPSVLSFANQDDAVRFAKGFKGEVETFSMAQRKIEALMKV